MSKAETAEKAVENINVVAETGKIIDDVSKMSWEGVLHEWVIPYGTKVLLAIAIFIIGKFLARAISKLLSKAALASTKDEMIQSFVSSISYFLLLLMVVIASLSQLGINTSSLVALIGAAGVMLLIFKPFRKGDQIETGGMMGTVEQMGILVLELRTADNKTVLIPNGTVFSGNIVNYSINPTRRLNFLFDIAYDSDLRKAKQIIEQILTNDSAILKTPAINVAVAELAASSVKLGAQAWVNTENYNPTLGRILEQVKLAFDEAGIVIPFNQLDVNLVGNSEKV